MSPIRMSKLESAVRVVLEFNEAFNRHDVAAMMQFISDDCIFEDNGPAPDGAVYSGKAEVAQYWQNFFGALPQVHFEIEEIFGFSERCIMRWRCNWVDKEDKTVHIRGVDLFRVRNALISEELSYIKG